MRSAWRPWMTICSAPSRRAAVTPHKPTAASRTAPPKDSTTPLITWPIRCQDSRGSTDRSGKRSLPQIHARVTVRRASVGSPRRASGTFSNRTSPAPYMTVALTYDTEARAGHAVRRWSPVREHAKRPHEARLFRDRLLVAAVADAGAKPLERLELRQRAGAVPGFVGDVD